MTHVVKVPGAEHDFAAVLEPAARGHGVARGDALQREGPAQRGTHRGRQLLQPLRLGSAELLARADWRCAARWLRFTYREYILFNSRSLIRYLILWW